MREHSHECVPRCVCERADVDIPKKTLTDASVGTLSFSPGSPELAAFERMNELVFGKLGRVVEKQEEKEEVRPRGVGGIWIDADLRGAESALAADRPVVVVARLSDAAAAAGRVTRDDSALVGLRRLGLHDSYDPTLVAVWLEVSPRAPTAESREAALRVVQLLLGIG